MDTKTFFSRFGQLHGQFRRGALPGNLREEYNFFCATLTQMMVAAQNMTPEPGTQRGALRMAKMLRAEIELAPGKKEKTSTIDIGQSGFAAVIAASLPVRSSVLFVLRLPLVPIEGMATVISARPQRGAFRTSFKFENLSQAANDALQVALIDSVLERVQGRAS